jgi:S-adenosylmethionine:diacylglycerol 3-amino-3-carboxypropyl transferase
MEMSSAVPATAWQNGRFRAGPRKLLFGSMYEDVAIELGAFQPGGRIFCIASAGCTAMRLAADHRVVAVDINPVQLAYVQRRLGGASIQRGSAERIVDIARTLAPIAGWSRRRMRAFLDLDDPEQQIVYWRRHLDTRRFRAAFAFLFSRRMLRTAYSAPFLECLPPNFGMVLRARIERCFALHPNRTNPYAYALFLVEMHFAPCNSEVRKIEARCADAADFLERQPACSFTGFSLSNILDGTNSAYQRRLIAAVQNAAAPGAMVVLRSFREPQSWTETNHAAEDRAMLWGIVDVRPASALRQLVSIARPACKSIPAGDSFVAAGERPARTLIRPFTTRVPPSIRLPRCRSTN